MLPFKNLVGSVRKAVSSVVDSVVPYQRPEDLFLVYWKRIEEIYHSDHTHLKRTPEALQNDPAVQEFWQNLSRITKLLVDEYARCEARFEEETRHKRGVRQAVPDMHDALESGFFRFSGPCFDLLVDKDVVPLLAAAAQNDRPPGTATHTLDTLRTLVKYFGDALIPQQSIHKSLSVMVLGLGRAVLDPKSPPSRRAHVARLRHGLGRFVDALLAKITAHPDLIAFFFFQSPGSGPEFSVLATALDLYFAGSEEEQDALAPSLLACLEIRSNDLSMFICEHTDFVPRACDQACQAYLQRGDASGGKRAIAKGPVKLTWSSVASFEPRHLRFFDQCAASARSRTRRALCKQFRVAFLHAIVRPALFEMNESAAVLALHNLRELLFLSSAALVDEVVAFLLDMPPPSHKAPSAVKRSASQQQQEQEQGQEGEEQLEDEGNARQQGAKADNEAGNENKGVLALLLQRLGPQASAVVSLTTLALFEALLALGRGDVLDVLVSSHVAKGVFAPPSEGAEELQFDFVGLHRHLLGADDARESDVEAALEGYLVDAESAVAAAVDAHDEAFVRTASAIAGNAREVVLKAVRDNAAAGGDKGGDEEGGGGEGGHCVGDVGPFLAALFERTSLMLDQPYHVNVALTGVFWRLCTSLDPVLHTLLLNPRARLRAGVPSLPECVRKMLEEARSEVVGLEDHELRLETARELVLAGDGVSERKAQEELVVFALVVLEEWSKELCATARAKGVMRDVFQDLDKLYEAVE